MNIRALLISTIMTTAALNALPACAQNTNMQTNDKMMSASASTASSNTTAQQMQEKSSEILGNISIANTALAYGMVDDAASHIAAARQAISAMNSQMTQADSSAMPMTAGKLTYKTPQGEADYWIPVINEHFAVRSLGGKHLMSKQPDIDVTDAESIHYKLFLDTKIADEQLAKAQAAIGEKKYDVAMNDLQGISKGAMSEMVAEDRPMEAARDNLILARELLQDKDYRGATFALKHANSEISRVEKMSPGTADNAFTKDMQSQITRLQATIAKENPSDLKMAETKIDGWVKDLKDKIEKL